MEERGLIKASKKTVQRVLAIPYFKDYILFYPLPLKGVPFHRCPKLVKASNKTVREFCKKKIDLEDPSIKFIKRVENADELEVVYPANFTSEYIEALLTENVHKGKSIVKGDMVTDAVMMPSLVFGLVFLPIVPLVILDLHLGRMTLKSGNRVRKILKHHKITFTPNQELQDFRDCFKPDNEGFLIPGDEQADALCAHFGHPNASKTVKKVKYQALKLEKAKRESPSIFKDFPFI